MTDQITVSRELLRQVIEALTYCEALNRPVERQKMQAITALRKALEQPAVEPVAWMDREGDVYKELPTPYWCPPHTPLYAAPQAQQPQEPQCNPHPDAPHGFDRNASHTLGRYVCDCEGWEPEPQLLTDEELRQIRKAKQGHDEFARAVEQAVLRKNGVMK